MKCKQWNCCVHVFLLPCVIHKVRTLGSFSKVSQIERHLVSGGKVSFVVVVISSPCFDHYNYNLFIIFLPSQEHTCNHDEHVNLFQNKHRHIGRFWKL